VQYFGAISKDYCRCSRQNIPLGKGGFAEREALGKVTHSTNLNFAECHSTRQNCNSEKGALPVTAATCPQILPSA